MDSVSANSEGLSSDITLSQELSTSLIQMEMTSTAIVQPSNDSHLYSDTIILTASATRSEVDIPSSSIDPVEIQQVQDDASLSTKVDNAIYQPGLDEGVDDEATIDQEENLGDDDDGELDELERLGEMPLEELLRLYGAASNEAGPSSEAVDEPADESVPHSSLSTRSQSQERPNTSGNEEDWTSSTDDEDEEGADDGDDETKKEERLKLLKFLAELGGGQSRSGTSEGSESDDEEFIPTHLLCLKRETPIGPRHQVDEPEIDLEYSNNVLDFDDEIAMWLPNVPEEQTIEFLKAAYIQERQLLNKEVPADQLEKQENEVADDEEFLKEFFDCKYDKDEALRRCRRNFRPGRYESSKWSEKECEDFEAVIAENWKRFTTVQAAVPTRTVKEVVEFYYRWKKSNRFEVFLAKLRFPDGKYHHSLEEKIKIRLGKKRPFDAMDAVAEDNLAISEGATYEPRTKVLRSDTVNAAAIAQSQSNTGKEEPIEASSSVSGLI